MHWLEDVAEAVGAAWLLVNIAGIALVGVALTVRQLRAALSRRPTGSTAPVCE